MAMNNSLDKNPVSWELKAKEMTDPSSMLSVRFFEKRPQSFFSPTFLLFFFFSNSKNRTEKTRMMKWMGCLHLMRTKITIEIVCCWPVVGNLTLSRFLCSRERKSDVCPLLCVVQDAWFQFFHVTGPKKASILSLVSCQHHGGYEQELKMKTYYENQRPMLSKPNVLNSIHRNKKLIFFSPGCFFFQLNFFPLLLFNFSAVRVEKKKRNLG